MRANRRRRSAWAQAVALLPDWRLSGAPLIDGFPWAWWFARSRSAPREAALERPTAAGLAIEAFPVHPSRPGSFRLCLQEGSVFADFDTDDAGIVSLLRISYDRFGCCDVSQCTTRTEMSVADSRLLLDALASREVETVEVEGALRRFFQENRDRLWSDALAAHDLL